MKKTLSIICTLALLCSAVSCSSVTKEDNSSPQETTLDPSDPNVIVTDDGELLDLSGCYKAEEMELPDGVFRATDIQYLSGCDTIVFCGLDRNCENPKMYKTDHNFTDFTEFSYDLPEGVEDYDYYGSSLLFREDGSFINMIHMEDHGGMKLPTSQEDAGYFDYEAYLASCTTYNMIASYSKDGELLSSASYELPEEFYKQQGADTYIISCSTANRKDHVLIGTERGGTWRLDLDGKLTRLTPDEPDDMNCYGITFIEGAGDTLFATKSVEKEVEEGGISIVQELYAVNDDDTIGEFIMDGSFDYSMTRGAGEYPLYTTDSKGMKGVKADGTMVPLINWLNSGIKELHYVISCGDDTFIGLQESPNTGRITPYKLTPRSPEDFKGMKFITIASYRMLPEEIINNFNNSQNDYRVKVVEIGSSEFLGINNNREVYRNDDLNMALISGNAPDIIFGLEYSDYQNYRKKGVFTDLMPYVESSETVNPGTLMPNLLSALKADDGGLYGLCTGYNIRTLAVKSKFYTKENWTFEEMMDFYDNLPAEMTETYSGQTKEEMLDIMKYVIEDMIDYDKGTCTLNDPKLKQILEFCNRFVSEVDGPTKMDDGWDVWQEWFYDKQMWFNNDKIPARTIYAEGPDFAMNKYFYAGGDELTFVGYPSSDGSGGRIQPGMMMSITNTCKNKDGAWKFLEYYVLNQYGEMLGYSTASGIPAVASLWDKELQSQQKDLGTFNGNKTPCPTQEDCDRLVAYNKTCTVLGCGLDYDTTKIIEEEAGLYFAGEQTVDAAADHISNRVSILVSERS